MSELNLSSEISDRAKEDIIELHDKIALFNSGEGDEEKFRSFRLARGVYGQRQEGVQMIRIKLPFGRVSAEQLVRIADTTDKYATEKMHATTRQDIQIHYVKLAESPLVWASLEEKGITLREACGNTVRNVTASDKAGVDPDELFDVSPYAFAFYEYFLRNPICQEMGRKFKVAFSSSDADTAYTWMHDIGFIPRIENNERGFKVVIAGGLGSQPMLAHTAYEFLPANQIIPFAEAVIRVFDRHGERASRGKARMKFVVKKEGFEAFMQLVEEEKTAVINKTYEIDPKGGNLAGPAEERTFPVEEPKDAEMYDRWFKTNVFKQKQEGYHGVYIKLTLGNIFNETARQLAAIVEEGYAADDIRVTVNQGFLLRYVTKDALIPLFNRLYDLDLSEPGFDSTADIVACPGTTTCNLGIASSTGIAAELERLMREEYKDIIYNNDIKIKISGCMNACGWHSAANIGFQGMSIKKGALVLPALQILLGGGYDKDGTPSIGDKVVKVPSKKAPDAFKALLEDYEQHAEEGEYFNNYYQRQVAADKLYFFTLLKPFTALPDEVPQEFFIDWGNEDKYIKAVGVGECAGVVLDLVGTLILEAEEKFGFAEKTLAEGNWQDAIYHCYNTFIVGAKALLTGAGIRCNTQIGIIRDFDKHFVSEGELSFDGKSFKDIVLQINQNEPSLDFAKNYYESAKNYLGQLKEARNAQIEKESNASVSE